MSAERAAADGRGVPSAEAWVARARISCTWRRLENEKGRRPRSDCAAARGGAGQRGRVSAGNPSPGGTRMRRSLEAGMMPEDLEAAHEVMSANIPMGRYAEPLDIANMMLFLASDEGAFMTGGVYMADGGSSAR